MAEGVRLADLVRQIGGWPIDLERVSAVLEAADEVLDADGGVFCSRQLTSAEIECILAGAGYYEA